MASSSNKTTSSQRVNAYLNCLQEEFELQSGASSNTRRFKIFLGNLKGEFELLSVEIDSLRKERDEYKSKVKNLIDRTISCDRCSKDTASPPRIVVPSQIKTISSLFSSRFQFKSRDQPDTSDASSREVALTHTPRSTQQMTLVQRLYSAITPTRPTQSTSHSLDAIIAHTIARPPSPEPSASTVDAGSGPEARDWSIAFNSKAEKELEVELTRTLLHERTIRAVKFSQDGKSLAAGCYDGKVYIYDVEAGTLTCVLRNLLVDDEGMTAVCFGRDGKYLATGTWNGYIYIWEIKEKYVRNAFRHTDYVHSLDFSPNGRLLVSASRDNTVRLWNMRDGSAKFLIKYTFLDYPHYSSAVFSPDGRYVAAGHRDGIARMWDVRTGRLMRRLNMQDNQGYWQWTDVKFMPDGKGLVGTSGRTCQCWDISTLVATQTTDGLDGLVSGVQEQIQPERVFLGHEDLVLCLAISPDGKWVASGAGDKSVRIWDARNAVMQCILDNVHDRVLSVDISPSGRYLASGGEGGMLRIWRYMTHGGS